MQPTADNRSAEIVRLRAEVATLHQELEQCHENQSAAENAEQHFRLFSERVQDYAFITFGPDSAILSWSIGAERIFGYSEAEVLGRSAKFIFTPEDRASGAAEDELTTAQRDGCAEDERWHVRKDGTRFWASGVMTAHRSADTALEGYSKVLRDLTARKLADDTVRATEEQFRLFAENVRDYALVPVDVEGMVSGWNTGGERTFGYSQEEIIGEPSATFFIPEDRASGEPEKDLSRALEHGRAEDERWMVRKDGTRFWSHWVTNPMHDSNGELRGFTKVLRDETEKKRADDLLKQALQDKELLLREIHHRVKNNLNIVNSLLSMQAGQVSDTSVQYMFEELQDRVRAIAALHETLYTSPNLADILVGPYIEHLLNELVAVHQVGPKHVRLAFDTDDMVLSIDQALPLGLIANELTSNALKHAFPDVPDGTITVSVRYLRKCAEGEQRTDDGCCELTVQDDGVGIADDDSWKNGTSMGLQIVRLLVAQLHGTITLGHHSGTSVSVQFPITVEHEG